MTDRNVEQALRTALEHAAPNDVESVLLRCDDRKGNVIPMTNQNPEKKNRKPLRLAALAAAACLVLAIGGGSVYYNQSQTAASVVSLDVNPSIELVLNSRERVLRATALNEDAAAVLDGMDLKGSTLDVAVNALMGSLLKNGYVDELANSILITVEDDDATRAAQLESQLTETVNAVMTSSSINGAILSQVVNQNQDLQAKADEYGISLGKAQLIQQLVDQNPTLTFESLAGRTVNDLNLLLSSQATTLSTVSSTGRASDGGYIGTEVAKNAALAHAGLTADQVTVSKVDFDVEDGRMVYEVEFWANNVEYEYDVDATTGEIVKNHTETYTAAAGQNGSIDQAAAKAAALSAFGLSEDQAEGIVVIPSFDDGRFVYKVKFWAGSTEYFCAVDGSGQILKSEKEEHASSGSVATSGTDVGLEAAKTAALKHAGLSADQVTGLTAKLDWDDGQRVYEVDFWQGSTEYEYEINADGTVRQYESEAHAAPTAISAGSGSSGSSATSTDIDETGAKAAALSAAGLTEDQVQNLFIERDWDDGRIQYEVKFQANGTRYEYEIDGSTGSVLKGENKATAASGSFISADEALAKALSHAGLDQSAIRELEMDSELDDDVPHYSIDFKSGNLEYEYEISATDGSVLKFEQDN
nr:PepSY domain-containing protein [Fournierella massiliensis]